MSHGSNGNPGGSSPHRARPAPAPTTQRLSTYLHQIRNHWLLGLVTFLLVAGAMVLLALHAEPQYEAVGTLQIDTHVRSNSLGELQQISPFDMPVVSEAEMRLITSLNVARRAAHDPLSPLAAVVSEVDAYRPIDGLMRRLGGGEGPCHLEARVTPNSEPGETDVFRLAFSEDGSAVRVTRSSDGEERTLKGFSLAEPFSDDDGDGTWDEPETYDDRNGNGAFDKCEPYIDENLNGAWDEAEPFTDKNGNELYDFGEEYEDLDGNGRWDRRERFTDHNGNEQYDCGEEILKDFNGDGEWTRGERFRDWNGDDERTAGTPLEFFGREIVLTRVSGNPAGKTFTLTMRSPRQLATWLRASTSAEEVSDWSGIIEVRGLAPTPHEAQAAANAVANAYLDLKLERKRGRASKLLDWITLRTKQVRGDLVQAERVRLAFITDNQDMRLGERAEGIYSRQDSLLRERFELSRQAREIRAKLQPLNDDKSTEELLTALGTAQVDPRTTALATSLADLRVELEVLSAQGVTSETRARKELETRILLTENELGKSVRSLVAERTREMSSFLSGLDNELVRLDTDLEELDENLKSLPAKERRLIELARPIVELEASLEELMKGQSSAAMTLASTDAGVYIVDEAQLPAGRARPNATRSILVALFLGLFCGIGIALFRGSLDRTLRTPDTLERRIERATFASIPSFRGGVRRGRVGHKILVARDAPNSAAAEAYRTLRANIRYASHEQHSVRTLAITSAVQQEGKTITTLNLAVTLAEAGSRVVVVDADLRRPTTHKAFDFDRRPGLVEYLRGEVTLDDVVRDTGVENLELICSGGSTSNPGALVDSKPFVDLLELLRSKYEYVLFDVPPVIAVSDAAAFLRALDGVLLLVRSGRYRLEVAASAFEQIDRLGADVLGIVFNDFDVKRAGSSGYYGYYSAYAPYAATAADD